MGGPNTRLFASPKTRAVVLITLLHAAATVGAFVLLFGIGMGRFDTGQEATLFEWILEGFVGVVFFPLVHLAFLAPRGWFPGLWGYLPILVNSALWACALVAGWSWFRRTNS